jgi:hypothetical protein
MDGERPHHGGNLGVVLLVLAGDRLQRLRDGFELTRENVSLGRQWIVGVRRRDGLRHSRFME